MANVLHRTTLQYYRSVNTPDFPVSDYVINPILPNDFLNNPIKYRELTGDIASIKDQATRDQIDADEETARLDAISNEIDKTQSILRAFAEVVLDEINNLRAEHGFANRTLSQLKTAVRGKL